MSVACDTETVGVIAVSTPVRPDAAPAVARLQRMGLETMILSGDAAPAVDAVAALVRIDSARAGLQPAEKLDALRALQADGHRVVMVGDGVNDVPALVAADVGCAVGSGSEIALSNSDVALLGSDLGGVPSAIGIATATSAVIVQNFGWAMGYNLSAIPLAAAGLLDPLIAALTMGVSSLIVVLNSLRLLRLGRRGQDLIRPPARPARGPGVRGLGAPPRRAVRRRHPRGPGLLAQPRPAAPAAPLQHHRPSRCPTARPPRSTWPRRRPA